MAHAEAHRTDTIGWELIERVLACLIATRIYVFGPSGVGKTVAAYTCGRLQRGLFAWLPDGLEAIRPQRLVVEVDGRRGERRRSAELRRPAACIVLALDDCAQRERDHRQEDGADRA
mgnify:CR=1 FL=1